MPEAKTGAELTAQDLMTPNPVTVSPEDRLSHAADLMEKHRVQHLPVIRDGHLVAILSERNLRDATPSVLTLSDPEARRRALGATRVEKIATPNPVTVLPTTSVLETIRQMRRGRLGSLPVVHKGELLGIVTAGDLINLLERLLSERPGTSVEAGP